MEITKALVIDEPWLSKILMGEKDWEMRSNNTKHRGPFGLIRKGSRQVVGIATLVDVSGPYSNRQLGELINHHQVGPELYEMPDYKWRIAWHLESIKKLKSPVSYRHKSGAVTWVNLDPDAISELAKQIESLS